MAEKKKREEKIGDALMKVALGCKVEEVTEEYAEVEGVLKLTKRRKTKKDIPPDLKAVQLLLGADGGTGINYAALSDEALAEEKKRLLEKLKQEDEREKKKSGENVKEKENDGGRDLTNENSSGQGQGEVEGKGVKSDAPKTKKSVAKKAAVNK